MAAASPLLAADGDHLTSDGEECEGLLGGGRSLPSSTGRLPRRVRGYLDSADEHDDGPSTPQPLARTPRILHRSSPKEMLAVFVAVAALVCVAYVGQDVRRGSRIGDSSARSPDLRGKGGESLQLLDEETNAAKDRAANATNSTDNGKPNETAEEKMMSTWRWKKVANASENGVNETVVKMAGVGRQAKAANATDKSGQNATAVQISGSKKKSVDVAGKQMEFKADNRTDDAKAGKRPVAPQNFENIVDSRVGKKSESSEAGKKSADSASSKDVVAKNHTDSNESAVKEVANATKGALKTRDGGDQSVDDADRGKKEGDGHRDQSNRTSVGDANREDRKDQDHNNTDVRQGRHGHQNHSHSGSDSKPTTTPTRMANPTASPTTNIGQNKSFAQHAEPNATSSAKSQPPPKPKSNVTARLAANATSNVTTDMHHVEPNVTQTTKPTRQSSSNASAKLGVNSTSNATTQSTSNATAKLVANATSAVTAHNHHVKLNVPPTTSPTRQSTSNATGGLALEPTPNAIRTQIANSTTAIAASKPSPTPTSNATAQPSPPATLARTPTPPTPTPTPASWDYNSFHIGDWPSRGYPLCAGKPDANWKHNEWQSPIDIPFDDYAKADNKLELVTENGGCSSVLMAHDGYTYRTSYAGCSNLSATWKSTNYTLQEFNFHAESENTLDGEHFPGEMHMVHSSPDGKILVISAFLQRTDAGPPVSGALHPSSSFLHRMFSHGYEPSRNITETGPLKRLLNPYREVLYEGAKFYTYKGSLTTPPCTPDVEWISLAKPVLVNTKDFAKFKHFLRGKDMNGMNKRPIQPRNQRPIEVGTVGKGAGLTDIAAL